jgi:thioesterase domain-containing protein
MNQALRRDTVQTDSLQQKLLAMPPVQALGLRVGHYDGIALQLQAPLAANINDKGSAFGGSLASLMTLAAWTRRSIRSSVRISGWPSSGSAM